VNSRSVPCEIYTRTAINPLDFGKLVVLNNENIHTNINANKIGVLGKDSIYESLYHEMNKGKSWKRTKTKLEPCKNYVFDVLYEMVVKKKLLVIISQLIFK